VVLKLASSLDGRTTAPASIARVKAFAGPKIASSATDRSRGSNDLTPCSNVYLENDWCRKANPSSRPDRPLTTNYDLAGASMML
jgi:hypothetical protein